MIAMITGQFQTDLPFKDVMDESEKKEAGRNNYMCQMQ